MSQQTPDAPLEAIEIETQPQPSHAVIWLHGLGADGNDFVPIVEQLDLPSFGIRFIFPHAPMMPVTINGGFVMRAWYDILGADLSSDGTSEVRREDESGIRASESIIRQFIDRENARGIEASNIMLAGFSQGGAIALQTGLRYAHKLAGVMALSSYLPLKSTLPAERDPANLEMSIFMAHGRLDNVLPMAMAEASRDYLVRMEYGVSWYDYPMMHEVCREELVDIGEWMTKVLV